MPEPLAVDGGAPVRSTSFPSWPCLGDEEAAAVERVVRSNRINYWTGEEGRQFEAEYAETLGRAHGIAVANGTLALELALRAFRIGAGDEVVVPARTFIATASAVVAVGATPVVADIEADSGNLTARTVADVVTDRTRAVIPVHVGGWPVDMDPLMELSRAHDFKIVEDCAQAHAGAYRGRPVGALGSHAATFSFCQDKILPVGEGGMLLLDDDDAYERAWAYKDHGKSLTKVAETSSAPGGPCFRWLVDSFGTNWRLHELAAAIGRVGLRKLPEWHRTRSANASRLSMGLSGITGLRTPMPAEDTEHAFYRLYSYVDAAVLAPDWTRDRIVASISAEGVPCQYGTCAEIYREAAFERAGLSPAERLPMAAAVHDTSVAFFVHPTLGAADIDDTIAAVAKVMEVATS